MSRLYDRIMRDPRVPIEYKTILSRAEVVAIDNVAEYLYTQKAGETLYFTKDYPSCVSPFPLAFYDIASHPSMTALEENGALVEWPSDAPTSWGVLAITSQIDPTSAIYLPTDADHKAPVYGARWEMQLHLFIADKGGIYGDVPLIFRFWLDESASLCFDALGGEARTIRVKSDLAERWYPEETREMSSLEAVNYVKKQFEDLVAPFLFAMSLMHCKNVVIREVAPPDTRRAKAKKRGVPPLVRYRVLDIEPMKTVLRTEGQIEKTGLKQALHICRGHFKTYDDKPLFGKVRGTFWWPSTVRGSLSEGAVVKDYQVHEPKPKKDGEQS